MRRTEQAQGLRLMKFEEVYARTTARLLIQAEAAEVLGVSERTFRRWRDRYEVEGAEGSTIGPSLAATLCCVASKWPRRICSSLIRSLEKKR